MDLIPTGAGGHARVDVMSCIMFGIEHERCFGSFLQDDAKLFSSWPARRRVETEKTRKNNEHSGTCAGNQNWAHFISLLLYHVLHIIPVRYQYTHPSRFTISYPDHTYGIWI